jgi:type II secretory pathway pseudopilin PulG
VESRAAFSLVEVLIAILILALGLLGLGAVIPVIVKQQRVATDNTLGVSIAKAAEAYLRNRPEFNPASTANNNAWNDWINDQTWSRAQAGGYLWQPWRTTSSPPEMDIVSGDMTFSLTSIGTPSWVTIKLEDRLWPSTSSQPMGVLAAGTDPYRPQFVWDMVGRRVQVNKNDPRQVQVAIFVRRIDPNIRIPRTMLRPGIPATVTLLDVLTNRRNNLTGNDVCIPVAVESEANPVPTYRGNNGPGNRIYGNVQSLNATFDPLFPDRIEFTGSTFGTNFQTLVDLASRPNQKLVDNLGNVYTVREVLDDPTRYLVQVDPPIPRTVTNTRPASLNDIDHSFRQVIFTPQIPGAVRVFTITRPTN